MALSSKGGPMRSIIASFVLFLGISAQGQFLPTHGPSVDQLKAMAKHNAKMAKWDKANPSDFSLRSTTTPFFEYGTTGYVVMNDDDYFGYASEIKTEIAKNLPSSATLIVYTESTNKNYQQQLIQQYSQLVPKERLKILQIPQSGSNSFWSRDNLPIPVFEDGKFALVDAKYYYNFEPDSYFSQLFNVNLLSHNYFYEGGNYLANSKGDCLVVNRKKAYPGGVSDTAAIPDDVFKTKYGCKKLTRFKHLKGIGHADEVMKFMSDDVILTDTVEYKPILEKAGYKVIMLPEADLAYETYANSLLVNDTIYVPTFGETNDQKALDIYKQFGLKVVGIPTRELATGGQGGIHCITMNYPPAPMNDLVRNLGAVILY